MQQKKTIQARIKFFHVRESTRPRWSQSGSLDMIRPGFLGGSDVLATSFSLAAPLSSLAIAPFVAACEPAFASAVDILQSDSSVGVFGESGEVVVL